MTQQEPAAEVLEFAFSWDDPEPSGAGGATATRWEDARQRLAEAFAYWLATVRPDGRPHVMPILGVWVDGALHFCASDRSRKAKNLARDPHCVVTSSAQTLDLVVEGRARPVDTPAAVQRVAEAYQAKYGWQPEVRDGLLWAGGAPTAGPPPYRVYVVTPRTGFGFPTTHEDPPIPTRWRF